MISNKLGAFNAIGGVIRGILAQPRECACGRMVCFVVNRHGKTRCVECDEKYLGEVKS